MNNISINKCYRVPDANTMFGFMCIFNGHHYSDFCYCRAYCVPQVPSSVRLMFTLKQSVIIRVSDRTDPQHLFLRISVYKE